VLGHSLTENLEEETAALSSHATGRTRIVNTDVDLETQSLAKVVQMPELGFQPVLEGGGEKYRECKGSGVAGLDERELTGPRTKSLVITPSAGGKGGGLGKAFAHHHQIPRKNRPNERTRHKS